MTEKKTIELIARYDADTKRTHRFILEAADGIAGTIYISKQTRPLPGRIILEVKTKNDR